MRETGIKSVKETGIRPIVIEEIRNFARKNGIKKVVLFGSRARGDHWRASDIDLAVWGGDIQNFAFDVDEKTSTLLKYDVIDMDKGVQEELQKSIDREGIVIYEEV